MNQIRWDDIQSIQPEVYRMLSNSFQYGRVGHAYVFEGQKGTKKLDTAFLVAKRLLCEAPIASNRPCLACHQCERIDHGTHPNVFLIQAEGEVIKKEQMKKMLTETAKTALEDRPRVFLINHAHQLNVESANTILKFMEEPGSNLHIILITDSVNSLLKTILSRSQVLHFKPLDRKIIRQQLLDKGVSPLAANVIPEYTNNLEMAQNIALDDKMMLMIDQGTNLYRLLLDETVSLVIKFKEIKDVVLQSKETIDFFLTIMIVFQKDIYHYQLRQNDQVVNQSELKTINELSVRIPSKNVERLLERMLTLKGRMGFNLNSSLAMDNLILQIERGLRHGI